MIKMRVSHFKLIIEKVGISLLEPFFIKVLENLEFLYVQRKNTFGTHLFLFHLMTLVRYSCPIPKFDILEIIHFQLIVHQFYDFLSKLLALAFGCLRIIL